MVSNVVHFFRYDIYNAMIFWIYNFGVTFDFIFIYKSKNKEMY